MDLSADNDVLEERWLQLFNEFQDFRSQRLARKATARDELDAAQKQIDAEIFNVHNEQNQSIEAMKGEADAKIRRIQEHTQAEIRRLQDDACRKTAEIHDVTKRDLGLLQVISERKTQELEDKRNARKRKHEQSNEEIESEFHARLKTLDKCCIPSVCTASQTVRGAEKRAVADSSRPCRTRRRPPPPEKYRPTSRQPTMTRRIHHHRSMLSLMKNIARVNRSSRSPSRRYARVSMCPLCRPPAFQIHQQDLARRDALRDSQKMAALRARVEFGDVMGPDRYAASARQMGSLASGLGPLLSRQLSILHATTPARSPRAARAGCLA